MSFPDAALVKRRVRTFWDRVPCDTRDVPFSEGSAEFFDYIEERRYEVQFHIPEVAGFAYYTGQRILDVGSGIGTDTRQYALRNQVLLLDISMHSLSLARRGFQHKNLPGWFVQGDSENLPILHDQFDLVWSHGSLHHTPDTARAVREIHRVLKPGGQAIAMLYHRGSYDYWINIRLLRRFALNAMLLPGGLELVHWLTGFKREFLKDYEEFARVQKGLSLEEYVSQNTDGLGNPLSRVYSKNEALRLFRAFRSARTEPRYVNRRDLMFIGDRVPRMVLDWLGRRLGFFLYVTVTK